MKIDKTEDTPRTGVLVWILIALAISVLIFWAVTKFLMTPSAPKNSSTPIPPKGIVFHHSATGKFSGKYRVDAAWIDNAHAGKGWGTVYKGKTYHIGYHYVILPDGAVQPGRPEGSPGAHARGVNDHYLGICFIGDFDSKTNAWGRHGAIRPTKQQIDAGLKLATKLMKKYNIPIQNVVCHRDVNQTDCPGDRFPYHNLLAQLFALAHNAS